MIQDKAQSAVARFSCLPVGRAQNTTWLGMSFTRAATPYWIIRVAPSGRVVKRSSAVLRLLVRTRHYRRDPPGGQPLHNSLNPSNHPCWTTSRLLKKPSMAFSTSPFEKRGFQMAPVFNGLQPSKMAVHPCTVRRLSKNRVFQQPARPGAQPASFLSPRSRGPD